MKPHFLFIFAVFIGLGSLAFSATAKETLTGTFVFTERTYTTGEMVKGTFTLKNSGKPLKVRVEYLTFDRGMIRPYTKIITLQKQNKFDIAVQPKYPGPYTISVRVTKPGDGAFKRTFRHSITVKGSGIPTLDSITAPIASRQNPIVNTSSPASANCPLTFELVRERCKIPASVALAKGSVLTTGECSVVVSGPYGEPYRVLSFHPGSTIKTVIGETPQPLNQEEVKKEALLQVPGYHSLAKPVAEDVTELGDYAFLVKHPLSKQTEDYRRGLRDAGFSLYTIVGTQKGRLISGGPDVYVAKEKGKGLETIGSGCDLEEIKAITHDIIVPFLTQKGGAEKTKTDALVRKKNEEIVRAHALAKEKCLSLSEIAQVCTGAEQPTDIQAFVGGEEGVTTVTCQYNAALDQGTQEALQGGGILIKERPYLQTAVTTVPNEATANISYGFAVKPFVNVKDVVGRNEIGTKSLRTKTALGFATKSKVVVITELNGNKTCNVEQILPLGKLLLQ